MVQNWLFIISVPYYKLLSPLFGVGLGKYLPLMDITVGIKLIYFYFYLLLFFSQPCQKASKIKY